MSKDSWGFPHQQDYLFKSALLRSKRLGGDSERSRSHRFIQCLMSVRRERHEIESPPRVLDVCLGIASQRDRHMAPNVSHACFTYL